MILAAEKPDSNIVILTSALALVEVVWLKPHPKLTPDKEQKIRDFFKHSWVSVIDVDPKTAEYARQLVWNHNIRPKDAIYVATAVLRKANCLDTFDNDLIACSGRVGNPPLLIGRPHMPEQIEMELIVSSGEEPPEDETDD